MFPDATAKWREFPSIIDGIDDPFVFDKGCWQGKLYLTVADGDGILSFGVILNAIAYFAIDEALFSAMDHACLSLSARPNCYIREATHSNLLVLFRNEAYLEVKDLRHFQFIVHDKCFECLCSGLPEILTFRNEAECNAWWSKI